MSVDKVHSVNTHGYASTPRNNVDSHTRDVYRKALADAEVGQEVSLRVINKLADHRFVAAFGDSRYVVESTVPLEVGATVKATVSAVGGIVELKYLGSGQFEAVAATITTEPEYGDGPGGAALGRMEQKYRVILSTEQRQWVQSLSDAAKEPEAMALGALYINKVGAPLDEKTAQALYARVAWNEGQQSKVATINVSAQMSAQVSTLIAGVQQGDGAALDQLAHVLADAVDQAPPPTTSFGGAAFAQLTSQNFSQSNDSRDTSQNSDQNEASLRELAQRLLNTQDQGALAYRYGSLPVLIGGQMVELDLLMFRERDAGGRGPTASPGLKKLVMTLRTESLGRVEIVAQSFDAKLSVAITAQSSQSTELLSAHAREVKDLVARLGWNVDSVSYRLASDPARAAGQLVKYVMASGSVDAMI